MLSGNAPRSILHPVTIRLSEERGREEGPTHSRGPAGSPALEESDLITVYAPNPWASTAHSGFALRRVDLNWTRGNFGEQPSSRFSRDLGGSRPLGPTTTSEAYNVPGITSSNRQSALVRRHDQGWHSRQNLGRQSDSGIDPERNDIQVETVNDGTTGSTPGPHASGNLNRITVSAVGRQSLRGQALSSPIIGRLADQRQGYPTPIEGSSALYGSFRGLNESPLQAIQQRIFVSRIFRHRRPIPRLEIGNQFLESSDQTATIGRFQDHQRTSSGSIGHSVVARSVMVQPVIGIRGTSRLRRSGGLSTAALGTSTDARTAMENRRLEGLHKSVSDLPLAVALQQSVLSTAGLGNSGGGAAIAEIMPKARTANTWRSNDVLWKKWANFCEADAMDPLHADEASLLRYLGWLYEDDNVNHSSVKNYVSAVITAQKRIGRSIDYTPLIHLALSAYKIADMDRKALENPELSKERRAFSSSVARSILRAAVSTADTDLELLRSASAVLISYVFFERGEAGAALLLSNITVHQDSIDIAIALRKNRSRVAHTLSYVRNPAFSDSLIDLLLRYDRVRRSSSSASKFYWSLPGTRHYPSARTMSLWLKSCLETVDIAPPPQVTWSSHSLRIGAASECAALGVLEYRICVWGDWSASRTFRESYLDATVRCGEDSHYFFGHLL